MSDQVEARNSVERRDFLGAKTFRHGDRIGRAAFDGGVTRQKLEADLFDQDVLYLHMFD
jgi:hypothetical protein